MKISGQSFVAILALYMRYVYIFYGDKWGQYWSHGNLQANGLFSFLILQQIPASQQLRGKRQACFSNGLPLDVTLPHNMLHLILLISFFLKNV